VETLIKLAYGANTPDALCVVAKNRQELDVQKCSEADKTQKFKVKKTVKHDWYVCAQENAKCEGQQTSNCEGEIRFGDGEVDNWAFPIAVPSVEGQIASLYCTPAVLRKLAVPEPVAIEDMDDPDYRECQCAGSGRTGKPAKGMSMGVIIGIAGGAVVLIGGAGFVVYKISKKKTRYGEGEEEWMEEEAWEVEAFLAATLEAAYLAPTQVAVSLAAMLVEEASLVQTLEVAYLVLTQVAACSVAVVVEDFLDRTLEAACSAKMLVAASLAHSHKEP